MQEMPNQHIKTYEMFRRIGKPDQMKMWVGSDRRQSSNTSTQGTYDDDS